MSDEVDKNENKPLYIILASLVLFIIVLVIAIVIVPIIRKPTDNLPVAEESLPLDIISDIHDKFYNYEYSLDETISRYEQEMQTGSNEKKIIIAIDYAKFTLDNTQDLTKAISVMRRVESLIKDAQYEIQYYEALRNLCQDAGNNECFKEYDNIISNLIEVPEEMSMEGESSDK